MQSDAETPLLGTCSSSELSEAAPLPPGPSISIIGSGDFSRSLAMRLLACGFTVTVGSRDPGRVAVALFPDGVKVGTQWEAAAAAQRLVIVAVFPEFYPTLLGLREPLAGKVLVDVSNAIEANGRHESNAERLAQLFPQSRVVKGLNGISAWSLQTRGHHQGSRQVPVCGDCPESKAAVLAVVHRLGFTPVDVGGLCVSRDLEEAALLLFPSWGGPAVVALLLLLFFYLYLLLRDVLLPYLDHGEDNFHRLPLVTVNEALPAVALVLLAVVYLPGLLAAGAQLLRGTKYRRFPRWLDRWLCRRKELGLLSFLCALLHVLYSLCLALRRPAGLDLVTAATQQVSSDLEAIGMQRSVWRSELYLSCGILGIGVLSLLAVTSLPSVGNSLSWREFTFVQSGLGFTALALSTLHTLLFSWDMAFSPSAYPYCMPPVHLLALVLPCLVLIGRVLTALPCLSRRLRRIRRGWESARHRSPPRDESREVNSFGDI